MYLGTMVVSGFLCLEEAGGEEGGKQPPCSQSKAGGSLTSPPVPFLPLLLSPYILGGKVVVLDGFGGC